MSTLFDSSVLIDHLRGRPAATKAIVDAVLREDGPPFASVLSGVETEGGMRSAERHGVRRLFDGLAMVPITDDIAKLAGEFLRTYRRSHSSIDLVDYVIAATAVDLGADLVTLNIKHFPMITDLRPPY
jgi:predicted nucleic acid-binding protein